MNKDYRLGIDTGGTFTDFVLYREGKVLTFKLPSTPHNPSQAIIKGIKTLKLDPSSLILIHGTTVGTNALLQRKGGRIALVTTRGFEDIIHIGRQTRKKLYSLIPEERHPIIPPQLCFGIKERIKAGGKIEQEIDQTEIDSLIQLFKRRNIQAIAVCFLHSYINPTHEKIVAQKLRQAGFLVSSSSELLPEYREFERMALTTLNAFLMPVMETYLACLEKELSGSKIWIMQSNGGFISPRTVRSQPIRTALSGPAAGVVAADYWREIFSIPQIITFDMGGTSTDVSLIDSGITRTPEMEIGGYPLRMPIIDIHTIGAGGGSIAYVDQGFALRVGPHSAGANPGPACYGRSRQPTVTDANLICGRLDPEFFLGGRLKIFPENSFASLQQIAQQLNKSVYETAEGIIQVANANMEKAIRVISIERGYDLRKFTLLSFGGAGGMHAAEIAEDLRLARVIIPNYAGVFSALGLLLAEAVKDLSLTFLSLLRETPEELLQSKFNRLSAQAIKEMQKEGFGLEEIKLFPSLEMRYYGQSYEIELPYAPPSNLEASFHQRHQQLYSYRQPDQPIEIVNLKIKALGNFPKIKLSPFPRPGRPRKITFTKQQNLYFHGKFYEAPVFRRQHLFPEINIKGPALISAEESTTFIPPNYQANVDDYLNIILERQRP